MALKLVLFIRVHYALQGAAIEVLPNNKKKKNKC